MYCYPLEHYQYWKKELQGRAVPGNGLPMGSFGENLTVEFSANFADNDSRGDDSNGNDSRENDSRDNDSRKSGTLLEDLVQIGDRFSVGSAEVIVSQPRLPCYKLGVKFQSDDMVKRFLLSRRMGFYFAVRREGEVGAGDQLKLIARDPVAVPVSEIPRLYIAKTYSDDDLRSVRRALQVETLPDSWKEYFRERLKNGHE